MLADENTPAHYDAIRWHWRLSIGEDAWLWKEQERLVERNGYTPLVAFFLQYKHLRESYIRQEWNKEDAAVPTTTRVNDNARFNEMAEASKPYEEAIPLISMLAPTGEVRTLTVKASHLNGEWVRRWPDGTGKEWEITNAEMTAINQTEQEIMEQLKLLPKLTLTQVQAAIDALPEDGPHGVVLGLSTPHK